MFCILNDFHSFLERPTILGIFLGLLFSVIGDFFLFFRKRFFVLGMIAFALAQMIYIYTFSFKPFKFALCLPYYIYGLVFCVFLFPNVQVSNYKDSFATELQWHVYDTSIQGFYSSRTIIS